MSNTVDVFPSDFRVWWNPNQPDEIHLVTNDPIFHDAEGERPGLWVTFSSKLESANYHPVCFNRCVRALMDADKPHPPQVEEEDRRLKLRNGLIAKSKKQQD